MDGLTVAEAGLRNLNGIFLVEIQRDGAVLPAVSPSRRLSAGDRLSFAGDSDSIVGFQRTPGLKSAEDQHMLEIDSPQHTFYEAVIGADSRLVGQTLADIEFRGRYQAAVVAVHRSGERVDKALGGLDLRTGDTLLIFTLLPSLECLKRGTICSVYIRSLLYGVLEFLTSIGILPSKRRSWVSQFLPLLSCVMATS